MLEQVCILGFLVHVMHCGNVEGIWCQQDGDCMVYELFSTAYIELQLPISLVNTRGTAR